MISIAWLQQILNRITAPSADATDNAQMRDVVGSKTDAAVTAVGTTKSLAGYVKGLVQEMNQRYVPASMSCFNFSGNAENEPISDSYTGKGLLTGVYMRFTPSDSTNYVYADITIDGTVFSQTIQLPDNIPTGTGPVTISVPFHHRFESSLSYEGNVTGGSMDIIVTYTKQPA